jgi:hypothetical protein
MRADIFGWHVPDLDPGETLQEVWIATGLKGAEGPTTWQELLAYATLTGEDLTQAEWAIVRNMSEAYCQELTRDNALAMSPMDKAARDE